MAIYVCVYVIMRMLGYEFHVLFTMLIKFITKDHFNKKCFYYLFWTSPRAIRIFTKFYIVIIIHICLYILPVFMFLRSFFHILLLFPWTNIPSTVFTFGMLHSTVGILSYCVRICLMSHNNGPALFLEINYSFVLNLL